MRAKNIAGSIALIAFGIAYGFLTTGITERTLPNTPGPPFFPRILTVCLLTLSVVWLIQSVRGKSDEIPARETIAGRGRRGRGVGLLAMLLYLTVLPYLGFLISTPPLFGVLMWVFGERRPAALCAYSLAVPLFFYALFKLLFRIQLPASPLFG